MNDFVHANVAQALFISLTVCCARSNQGNTLAKVSLACAFGSENECRKTQERETDKDTFTFGDV